MRLRFIAVAVILVVLLVCGCCGLTGSQVVTPSLAPTVPATVIMSDVSGSDSPQIAVSGTGTEYTPEFHLDKGLAIVTLSHSPSVFGASLIYPNNSVADVFIQDLDNSSEESRAISVEPGNYSFVVQSVGPWDITIINQTSYCR